MLQISALYIYPIKSLGGITLQSAMTTDRGLQYDRRWMLIDGNNRFLSQREHAQLALCRVVLTTGGLQVDYTPDGTSVAIPLVPKRTDTIQVTIWDDTCHAQLVDAAIDEWFSGKLNIPCRLVYMPDESLRQTDLRYTENGTITSFSDAYPILMIGQASLDDLNSQMQSPLSMDRFRPNIVFTGGEPYSEDLMKQVCINGINMFGVKLCARCVMTTIDQQSASKGKEPLKTLSKYRLKNNKIYFGQNLVQTGGNAIITIGDEITVLALHTAERFMIKPLNKPFLDL